MGEHNAPTQSFRAGSPALMTGMVHAWEGRVRGNMGKAGDATRYLTPVGVTTDRWQDISSVNGYIQLWH
jgi:hypothetical protein